MNVSSRLIYSEGGKKNQCRWKSLIRACRSQVENTVELDTGPGKRVSLSLSFLLPRSFVVPLIAHKKMSLCLEPQCEPAFLFDRTNLTCTLRLFRMKLARPATFCRPRILYVSRVSLPGDGAETESFHPFPVLSLIFPALRPS